MDLKHVSILNISFLVIRFYKYFCNPLLFLRRLNGRALSALTAKLAHRETPSGCFVARVACVTTTSGARTLNRSVAPLRNLGVADTALSTTKLLHHTSRTRLRRKARSSRKEGSSVDLLTRLVFISVRFFNIFYRVQIFDNNQDREGQVDS